MPHTTPSNKTLIAGVPLVEELKLTTGTDCYAGRLVTYGSDDEYGVVGTAILPPVGFISFEHTSATYQPDTYTTAFAADDIAAVISGAIIVKGKLAKYTKATKGDLLANWASGQVVPAALMQGGIAVKVPFSKQTSAHDTVTLPAGVIVKDVIVQVTTAVSGATIDVGLKTTDPDGFLDGESCATAGLVAHNMVDSTAANNTLGVLLVESDITSADGTALYLSVKKEGGYLVGSDEVLVYTTSDSTGVAGYLYVVLEHPNFQIVGKADADADATSAATDINVRCFL